MMVLNVVVTGFVCVFWGAVSWWIARSKILVDILITRNDRLINAKNGTQPPITCYEQDAYDIVKHWVWKVDVFVRSSLVASIFILLTYLLVHWVMARA